MKRTRFTEEQIIGMLKEHEAGIKMVDLSRWYNVSTQSLYRWRLKYGGMEVSEEAVAGISRLLKTACQNPCSPRPSGRCMISGKCRSGNRRNGLWAPSLAPTRRNRRPGAWKKTVMICCHFMIPQRGTGRIFGQRIRLHRPLPPSVIGRSAQRDV